MSEIVEYLLTFAKMVNKIYCILSQALKIHCVVEYWISQRCQCPSNPHLNHSVTQLIWSRSTRLRISNSVRDMTDIVFLKIQLKTSIARSKFILQTINIKGKVWNFRKQMNTGHLTQMGIFLFNLLWDTQAIFLYLLYSTHHSQTAITNIIKLSPFPPKGHRLVEMKEAKRYNNKLDAICSHPSKPFRMSPCL